MGLLTPLGLTTPEEFMAVQMATANKLIDVATKQTGTTADDWVVRPFVPDGQTGPTAASLPGLQTPDLDLTSNANVTATQLGWDMDLSGVVEPSVSWITVNNTTTVPDQKFYGVYGWWEDAVYGGAGITLTEATPNTTLTASLTYPPVTQGWRFVSGAQTLDMWMTEMCHGWSEAVGGITKSPIIYTQNSNINLDIWIADSGFVSTPGQDHRLGLFMLTCERVGETIAEPGIHTIVPGGLVTSQMFQDSQNSTASELMGMATKATNTPASDWLVRGFWLDDANTGVLSNNDLSGSEVVTAASMNGWQIDASAFINGNTWYTALADTTVPDNKFYGFHGGFQGHAGLGHFGGGVAAGAPRHMTGTTVAAWALKKGASTVAFWPCQEVNAWYQNWNFIANKPVFYDQNSTIDIWMVANDSNYSDMDYIAGLMGLTAERIGENISNAKISN